MNVLISRTKACQGLKRTDCKQRLTYVYSPLEDTWPRDTTRGGGSGDGGGKRGRDTSMC